MEREELINIYGGASVLKSAVINAAVKGLTLVLELGRSLGSAIRRAINRKSCSL